MCVMYVCVCVFVCFHWCKPEYKCKSPESIETLLKLQSVTIRRAYNTGMHEKSPEEIRKQILKNPYPTEKEYSIRGIRDFCCVRLAIKAFVKYSVVFDFFFFFMDHYYIVNDLFLLKVFYLFICELKKKNFCDLTTKKTF